MFRKSLDPFVRIARTHRRRRCLQRHMAIKPDTRCVLFVSDRKGLGGLNTLLRVPHRTVVVRPHDDKHTVLRSLREELASLSSSYSPDDLLVLFLPPFHPFSYFNGWDFLQHSLAIEGLTVSYLEPFLYHGPEHPFFRTIGTYLRGLARTDYLEFGTYVGTSLSAAGHCLHENIDRFFAFDSFAGLIGTEDSEKEVFADGQYSVNERSLIHNLNYAHIDTSRVVTHQVNFLDLPETGDQIKRKYDLQRSLVIHIDCDIYEPAKAVLDFVRDMLMQGTILMLDDYNAMYAANDKGLRRALKEFRDENSQFSFEFHSFYGPHQAAFIVHRQ